MVESEVVERIRRAAQADERYVVSVWPGPSSWVLPEPGPQTGWGIFTESWGITLWETNGEWRCSGGDDEGGRFLTDELDAVEEWFRGDPTDVAALEES